MLSDMCLLFHVVGIDKKSLLAALNDELSIDFEDGVQMQCAGIAHADYIITRNISDFKFSIIPAMTPDDFCMRFIDDGK